MLKILVIHILMLFQQAHVTMTSIEYVPGTDSIKVLVRIENNLFLRDYQQTINDDLDLYVLRKYKPFPPDLVNNYLNSKIYIYADKKLLTGKLLDSRETDGYISFNILYRLQRKFNSLTVRNTLLAGLFSDVENLTIVRSKNFEKGIKFTQTHNEETLILK